MPRCGPRLLFVLYVKPDSSLLISAPFKPFFRPSDLREKSFHESGGLKTKPRAGLSAARLPLLQALPGRPPAPPLHIKRGGSSSSSRSSSIKHALHFHNRTQGHTGLFAAASLVLTTVTFALIWICRGFKLKGEY